MRTALLDGDTLIYAASSASEYETQFDEWTWVLWGNLTEAQAILQRKIERIEDELAADEIIVALSADTRFRPSVMPDYKCHRNDSRKPIVYRPLREWVHRQYRTYEKPYLEGDDVLGILATHPKVITGDRVIVAIDKDLRTIPGQHYNYDTEEFFTVSEREADYFFLKQALMGDRTDGYTGCPGVGPKTADKILQAEIQRVKDLGGDYPDIADFWSVIVQTYESKGLTEADALMNARVARICRHTDYDYKRNEVILWAP